MKSFKDTSGRDWKISLTVAEVEDLFDIGIDLGKESDVEKIFDNPKTFLAVLWVFIGEQVKALNLTDRDVKRAFGADAWNDAANALMEEIISFTPRRREMESLLAAVQRRRAKVTAEAVGKLAGLVEKIDAGAMDQTLGLSNSVTASPESAESPTPDPSHFVA
jgi:hypothetical protein